MRSLYLDGRTRLYCLLYATYIYNISRFIYCTAGENLKHIHKYIDCWRLLHAYVIIMWIIKFVVNTVQYGICIRKIWDFPKKSHVTYMFWHVYENMSSSILRTTTCICNYWIFCSWISFCSKLFPSELMVLVLQALQFSWCTLTFKWLYYVLSGLLMQVFGIL